MNSWQIILSIVIVGSFIIIPIYYTYQRKKNAQKEEFEKIKAYGENINEGTRNKNK